MPTYEYVCKTCGETIEVFQSFKDKPLKTHAGCGGELQKVFHARGIVFKGSGFYVTDSRGKKVGTSKSSKSESSDSTATSAGASSSSSPKSSGSGDD